MPAHPDRVRRHYDDNWWEHDYPADVPLSHATLVRPHVWPTVIGLLGLLAIALFKGCA